MTQRNELLGRGLQITCMLFFTSPVAGSTKGAGSFCAGADRISDTILLSMEDFAFAAR